MPSRHTALGPHGDSAETFVSTCLSTVAHGLCCCHRGLAEATDETAGLDVLVGSDVVVLATVHRFQRERIRAAYAASSADSNVQLHPDVHRFASSLSD